MEIKGMKSQKLKKKKKNGDDCARSGKKEKLTIIQLTDHNLGA